MLCRVYPHMKKNILQAILHGCRGDVAQAVEQVKRTHGDAASAAQNFHDPSAYFDFPYLSSNRSAFSPIMASLSLNPALLRYAALANAAASLGGAQTTAFPPVLPNALPPISSTVAGLYSSLNNNLSADSATKSLFGQSPCQCLFGKSCNIHPSNKHFLGPRASSNLVELSSLSPPSS